MAKLTLSIGENAKWAKTAFCLECVIFWRREGVLHHGLHPDNCVQASLDLTEHCGKHTTLGAYDPLSRPWPNL
jgi:hypothetical protein